MQAFLQNKSMQFQVFQHATAKTNKGLGFHTAEQGN